MAQLIPRLQVLGGPRGAGMVQIRLHSGFSPASPLFQLSPDDKNETFSSFLPLLNKDPLPQVRSLVCLGNWLRLSFTLFLHPGPGLPRVSEKDCL